MHDFNNNNLTQTGWEVWTTYDWSDDPKNIQPPTIVKDSHKTTLFFCIL